MDDSIEPIEVADHDFEFEAAPPLTDEVQSGREMERAFIERCREAMTPQCPGWDYLRRRGFTDDEIARFGFGYDPTSKHAYADRQGGWHRERVVMPWIGCDWYHTDRAIRDTDAKKYVKPDAKKVGPQPMFNAAALDGDVVFVVEGLADAYAVEACGHHAIATAGTGLSETVSAIAGRGYHGTVIAMLDYDEPGREANGKLVESLSKERVAVYAPDGSARNIDGCKDAGEALQRDREALSSFLDDAAKRGAVEAERAAQKRYDKALGEMHARNPFDVAREIYDLVDVDEPVPTGIRGLDDAIGGGLHSGMTVIGAISSLGKTTLAVQVADHIAASGRSVLFATVEQSGRELVAKSITRLMRQRSGLSVSTREITSRKARAAWNDKTNLALVDALNAYESNTAEHLRIYEGDGRPSVESIRAVAERMQGHDGQAPVVFVDYLQLLAPQDAHDTDKRAVDGNMLALRQMARELRTPVFVISSLNRSSYSGAISLDSFKESGMVEYSADLLLGLQPYGMADKLDGVTEQRKKSEANRIVRDNKASLERPEEIIILKNRNGGIPSQGVPLTFYPVPSLFRDGLHGQQAPIREARR